jgi:RND family efflux transporter MFP subunit
MVASMRRQWKRWSLLVTGGALVALLLILMAAPRPVEMSAAAQQELPTEAATFAVAEQEIEDVKTVFATVRSKDRIEARVRIAGTVAELRVDEGRHVEAGEVLALVADQKIVLKMAALDAQILGARSRSETAKTELDRTAELLRRGVAPQARYDQLKAAYDTAANDLKSAEAERAVVARQLEEGQVLSPAAGRILRVPVTVGTVVMPGESIATIAANAFLLRIQVPERHARFIKICDPIKVGARGLAPDQQIIGVGHIVQVYPELDDGRVVADAEAEGLGNFFVGERALVWISAGKRRTIIVPGKFVFKRFGLDYVRLARDKAQPIDVVVQLGNRVPMAAGVEGVEVLAGLKAGDVLVEP